MIKLVDRIRRKKGMTVVITIHTPEDIATIAERVAFVAAGRVIATGSPAEILKASRAPQIAEFLG